MSTALDGLVREYRTWRADLAAAEENGPLWSPIRAQIADEHATAVARQIADLLAAQPADVPALV